MSHNYVQVVIKMTEIFFNPDAMKKFILPIITILLIYGCRQEEEKKNPLTEIGTMEMAGILPGAEDPSTRTTLHNDGLLTLWNTDDSIGVFGSKASNIRFNLSSGADTPLGIFNGPFTETPLYAYYPYSQSAGDSYNKIRGQLDSVQEQDGERDMFAACDWKVSTSITGNEQDGYRIYFREIMTLLSFTIDATGTPLEGEFLRSVTLTANNRKLAGNFSIDLSALEAVPVFDEEAEGSVTLNLVHQPVLEAGKPVTCRMMVNAGISVGDTLKITLETSRSISTTTIPAGKTMKSGYRYHVPLLLSELRDNTIIRDMADQYRYNTYGIYHKEDTLVSYKAFRDQWSIMIGKTHYIFRIQNNAQKKIVSIENIPLNPGAGEYFNIEVSVYGAGNIRQGTKRVRVIRCEDHKLLLYDYGNETSYLVYN
jgi:hypothetical protein